MDLEEQINRAIFKAVSENKIPYTQEGIDFLLEEANQHVKSVEYEIKIHPLDELSVEDRTLRRLPTMEIIFK